MTSAKFSDFLTPSRPPCLHFHATSLTKLPYCICFWGTPLPPPCADIICTCPLTLLQINLFYSSVNLEKL